MPRAYWVQTANWRQSERMTKRFHRLNEDWAYSKDRDGEMIFWHVIPTPEKRPERQTYVTFERKRWHEAGSVYKYSSGGIRKTCELCKKKIPVPLRVMFELKGK